MANSNIKQQEDVSLKPKDKVGYPSMYKVVLLNDDYTPMDFVVKLLEEVFEKTREEAEAITMDVHKNGVGVCGVYTFEVAETKTAQVLDISRRNGYPLQCEMEKE